jgi:uncharacterized protein YjbI with pentapeptide repeats
VARQRSGDPTPPRLPPALPSEPGLTLGAGDHLSGLTIEGAFSGGVLEELFLEDCQLLRTAFVATDLHRLRLVDVVVDGCDLSGSILEEASFTRVAFRGCRMSGAHLALAHMTDVTFEEVRLDEANLRMMEGERVQFDDVTLRGSDLSGARLTQARFFDCDLTGCDVSQTVFAGLRLHGSIVSGLKGAEYLRHATIETSQVLPLAEQILSGLDIRIADDRDAPAP